MSISTTSKYTGSLSHKIPSIGLTQFKQTITHEILTKPPKKAIKKHPDYNIDPIGQMKYSCLPAQGWGIW